MRILIIISILITIPITAQSSKDSLAIKKVALAYLESQHKVKPSLFEKAVHPRLVKRTFWKNKQTNKEYLRETFKDAMLIVAETYNSKGDKFSSSPKKEVVILDIFNKTASVKLIADDWVDYMHIVKLNNKWQIVNVLWQFNSSEDHQ